MKLHRLVLLIVGLWVTSSLIYKAVLPAPDPSHFHQAILRGETSLRDLAKESWKIGAYADTVLKGLNDHPNKEVRYRARAISKIRVRQAKLVSQGVPLRIWIP